MWNKIMCRLPKREPICGKWFLPTLKSISTSSWKTYWMLWTHFASKYESCVWRLIWMPNSYFLKLQKLLFVLWNAASEVKIEARFEILIKICIKYGHAHIRGSVLKISDTPYGQRYIYIYLIHLANYYYINQINDSFLKQ